MRKFSPFAILFFLLFSLMSCTGQDGNNGKKDAATAVMKESTVKEEPEAAKPLEDSETTVFQATVLEVSKTDYLVEPAEGSAERRGADRIMVSTDGLADDTPMPRIGDVIEITYDGWIAETYPVRINHVSDIRIITSISGLYETSDENGNSGVEIIKGENFSAQILGDELILDLKSNATTGYTWVIAEEPEQFASDYDAYVEPDNTNGMVGVEGITEFHIIALQEGTGTMIFQYKRNWEGGETAGTYELILEISSDLQIRNISFEQAK